MRIAKALAIWGGAMVGLGVAFHYLGFDLMKPGAANQMAGPAQRPPPALAVITAPVRVGTATEQVEAVGTLIASEAVILRPEIAGRVRSLNFSEGQAVAEGQTLVTLDPAEYQAEVAQKQAAVTLWELKTNRGAKLLGKRVLSKQEYDEMEASLKQAQADLALAHSRLDKATLRAPFRGTLGLRRVSPGDYVDKGQDLVNLEAIDPIKIDLKVPERYAGGVHSGQRVSVRVEPYPEQSFEGEIYAIDPRLEEASRSVWLRGQIPNPEGALRPGMFARAKFALRERPDALWTPEQAIVPMGQDQYVFRVLDGRAALTKVRLGLRQAGEVEVKSGLDPGDVVITDGQMKVQDGMLITPIDPSPGPKPDGGPNA